MAVVRELREETGLDVEVKRLIGVYSEPHMKYPNGDEAQCINIVYELNVVGGELRSDECETLQLDFFALESVPQLFCRQHTEILETLKLLC